MRITFTKIRYKNFMSVGDKWCEIALNEHSKTLVVGSNGTSKSTLIEAVHFALFGTPFRNINIPQLINSVNKQDCLVEIEFIIGKSKYMVRRGLNKKIFEIYKNGKLIDKDSKNRDYQSFFESNILGGITRRSFVQVVLLGSSIFIPFMRLALAERRKIIEDLLDISVFSKMNEILKERSAELKVQEANVLKNLEIVSEKIALIEDILKNMRDEVEKYVSTKNTQISTYEKELKKLEAFALKNSKKIAELKASISDEVNVRAKYQQIRDIIGKLKTKLKRVDSDTAFFTGNNNCPTCTQVIDISFKTSILELLKKKRDELDESVVGATKLEQSLLARAKKIDKILVDICACESVVSTTKNEIMLKEHSIRELSSHIKSHVDTHNTGNKAKNELALAELGKNQEEILDTKNSIERNKIVQNIATTMLKDSGIKTVIVRKYLPVINKFVNKYLQMMNFFINFVFDENFNEQIKSRNREDFSYNSFSEGEKQRIDLALLFTWRETAVLKNSLDTNLLILDEIFDSSLDDSGIDDFMKILDSFGSKTNTIIISHKGDVLIDKFEHILKFERVGNFSTLVNT